MFTATKGILEGCGYEVLTMKGAGHEVRILPLAGFNFYYWTYEGKEILMEPVDITVYGTKYGTPVLFPTPNRVKNGTYTWEGKQYTMHKKGQPIIIHGLVKDELFEVTKMEAGEDYALCKGRISLTEENGLLNDGYPFPSTLTVAYKLTAEGVHMDVQIDNDGDKTMPFGFAVHPYFSKRGDANKCFIKVPVKRAYEADENLIPSGKLIPAEDGLKIWDDFHSVESLYLDTVYRGLSSDVDSMVKYEDMIIHINASDAFRNAVVYTPHNRPGFCIEPQTNATNFLNLHANGFIDESGLLVLQAGQSFKGYVKYTVEKI